MGLSAVCRAIRLLRSGVSTDTRSNWLSSENSGGERMSECGDHSMDAGRVPQTTKAICFVFWLREEDDREEGGQKERRRKRERERILCRPVWFTSGHIALLFQESPSTTTFDFGLASSPTESSSKFICFGDGQELDDLVNWRRRRKRKHCGVHGSRY